MRALTLCVLLVGCGEAAVVCPAGTTADDARALRIRTRLESVERGAALVREAGERVSVICFAAPRSTSVVDASHRVMLATELDDGEAAARLGHLLVHLRDGLPDANLHGPDCDAAVEHALALEATAYVEEISLQAELAVTPRVLAFEPSAEILAAPPDAREAIMLAYLRAHPNGAPGIDALSTSYRARCESSR
jgi:hypothetical protein